MAGIFQATGWLLFLLGILLAGMMGIMAVDGPPLTDQAGAVWIKFHAYSLGQFQVLVQRTLGFPDLWDDYLVPVLRAPAWQSMTGLSLASFLLGGLFLLGARSRRRAGIIREGNHMS